MKFKDIASLIEEGTDKKNILAGLDKMSQQYNAKIIVGIRDTDSIEMGWHLYDAQELYEHLRSAGDGAVIDDAEVDDLSLQAFLDMVTKGDIVSLVWNGEDGTYHGILSTNKELLKQEALQTLNLDKLQTLY